MLDIIGVTIPQLQVASPESRVVVMIIVALAIMYMGSDGGFLDPDI